MNKFSRAGIALLALAAASAPTNAAFATPLPAATGNPLVPALTAVYVVGLLLCTGMTFGRQDVLAAKTGAIVTGPDRFKAFAGCLLPPVGLANLGK